MEQWITVARASVILGVSERQVQRYCHHGTLVSEKGKAYSIELESVLDLLRSNEILVDPDIDLDTEPEEMSSVSDTAGINGHTNMSASPKGSDIGPDELFRKTAELLRTWSEYLQQQKKDRDSTQV